MAVAITQELGRFISGLRYADIPAEAIAVMKMGFADSIGAMIVGAKEPAATTLRSVLAAPAGPSRLFWGADTAPAPEAAFINGVAGHALDYDDVAQRGHPSTVLMPAIIAEAQVLGASGEEMLCAYAAGYETWAELVRRDPDQHHEKGWHPTGIFGAIAAAAACARLHHLNAEQTTHAIALGASQSAGLMANFGTMTKPFHAGRSAQSGLLAARLAKAGFTASPDALEHPQGYLSAVSPARKVDRDSPVEAGRVWKLVSARLGIKKYPLCYCTHRILDATFDMIAATPIAHADVRRVVVHTSRHFATILRNALPQTGLEAKFSMQFAVSSMLVVGRAGLLELQDHFVTSPEIQSLMKRVVIEPDDREDPATPGKLPFDCLTVEMNDGRVIESRQVKHIRGGAELPLSRDALWGKFEDCVKSAPVNIPALEVFNALMSLETVANVNQMQYAS